MWKKMRSWCCLLDGLCCLCFCAWCCWDRPGAWEQRWLSIQRYHPQSLSGTKMPEKMWNKNRFGTGRWYSPTKRTKNATFGAPGKSPPLLLSNTKTRQTGAGNYSNCSHNHLQNEWDNWFCTKSDCLKKNSMCSRGTQTKVWIPESAQMEFLGKW